MIWTLRDTMILECAACMVFAFSCLWSILEYTGILKHVRLPGPSSLRALFTQKRRLWFAIVPIALILLSCLVWLILLGILPEDVSNVLGYTVGFAVALSVINTGLALSVEKKRTKKLEQAKVKIEDAREIIKEMEAVTTLDELDQKILGYRSAIVDAKNLMGNELSDEN